MPTAGHSGKAGSLYVFSGPSGAGKGTLVKALLKKHPNIVLSISATTRPMRPGERNGTDYIFLAERAFLEMRDRGDFLEWAEVYGNHYGTPRGPVEAAIMQGRDVLCEIDIQGAMAIKRSMPDAVLVFIEPPSLDELFLRLRGRGTEDPETLSRRLKAAYDEVKRKGAYDHIVVNDKLDTAVSELERIIEG